MIGLLNGERTLGEMRRGIPAIFSTPELRLPASILDFTEVRDRLRATFPGAEQSDIDSVRFMLDEGVVLARESSTEPVVSLRIEGFSPEGFEKLTSLSLASLGEAGELLRALH
jgi:phosphomannomutase